MTSWADPPRPSAEDRARSRARAAQQRRRTALIEAGFYWALVLITFVLACGLALFLGWVL